MDAGARSMEQGCEMTRERDEQKRMRIVEITRMASCRVYDHLIRHNISPRRINSEIAIAREQFFFFLPATVLFFLQQSNYRGFIAGINNARRLFGRLKLTTAIYLEHYMPVQ